jgi:hypothetical protein
LLKWERYRERDHFLEIFKVQEDEIVLPYVADRFLCPNIPLQEVGFFVKESI